MDNGHTQSAALGHEPVQRLYNFPAPGRGAGAGGIFGQVPVMHVDGNDGGIPGVQEHLTDLRGNLFAHVVEISLHLHVLLFKKYVCFGV